MPGTLFALDSVFACFARTVLAPIDPPLPDPEVTPALVRLPDRRRDRRAFQPIRDGRPPGPPVLAEGQFDGFAAPAGAVETGPLVDAIAHDGHLPQYELIRRRVCGCYSGDQITSWNDAEESASL